MTDAFDLKMEEMKQNHEIDRWKFENEMEKLRVKNPKAKSGDDTLLLVGVAILGSLVTAGVTLATQPGLLKGIMDFIGLGKKEEPKEEKPPEPPPQPEPRLRLRPKYLFSSAQVGEPIGNHQVPKRSYRFQMSQRQQVEAPKKERVVIK